MSRPLELRLPRLLCCCRRRVTRNTGVLDEVNVAITTERKEGLENFVIPVRIDGLAFSSIRANLARKQIIDGSGNLALALEQVISTLEGLNVPRRYKSNAAFPRSWRAGGQAAGEQLDGNQWDILVENRLEIVQWPLVLRRLPGLNGSSTFAEDGNAIAISQTTEGGDRFCFATPEEMENSLTLPASIHAVGEMLTEDVLADEGGSVGSIDRASLRRVVSNLAKQGWERRCREQELVEFRISGRRSCWFMKRGTLPKNEMKYVDIRGRGRRRNLVGRSNQRGVYWHFAIEAALSIDERSLRVRPHVVFTEDGSTPIESTRRQHMLRRGFCRNWWNARWRELLSAMLQYVAAGEECFTMPVSKSMGFVVSSHLACVKTTQTGWFANSVPYRTRCGSWFWTEGG